MSNLYANFSQISRTFQHCNIDFQLQFDYIGTYLEIIICNTNKNVYFNQSFVSCSLNSVIIAWNTYFVLSRPWHKIDIKPIHTLQLCRPPENTITQKNIKNYSFQWKGRTCNISRSAYVQNERFGQKEKLHASQRGHSIDHFFSESLHFSIP